MTEASQQLQALYDKARQSARGYLIIIRVLQALAAETAAESLTFLTEALELGEPQGYIRTFVDEGKLLRPLLRLALSRGIMPEYTTMLLATIEGEERDRKVTQGEAVPIPSSNEFLSQREIGVLRLVAEGFSNQQIAQKLTISLNTAKTHVAHVFGKLNAKDRLQAVNRARELKLI
jgi:LuxR family maltose regulon positive regulatory protein